LIKVISALNYAILVPVLARSMFVETCHALDRIVLELPLLVEKVLGMDSYKGFLDFDFPLINIVQEREQPWVECHTCLHPAV